MFDQINIHDFITDLISGSFRLRVNKRVQYPKPPMGRVNQNLWSLDFFLVTRSLTPTSAPSLFHPFFHAHASLLFSTEKWSVPRRSWLSHVSKNWRSRARIPSLSTFQAVYIALTFISSILGFSNVFKHFLPLLEVLPAVFFQFSKVF